MSTMRSVIGSIARTARASRAGSSRQTLGDASTALRRVRYPAVRGYATRESATRDRSQIGPVTWKAGLVFIVTGVGLYFYFESEKEKLRQKKIAEQATKSIGKPSIGGPFNLLDAEGRPFTEQDLRGKWTLMYFGFTHCPDICPEELDKMGVAVDLVEKKHGEGAVLPVFISVDPARDSVPQVKQYIHDFHPRMIGLTGDYDSVKRACKSYRVYFSSPPNVKPGEDYLVDHSIFFYLMDPLGQFVDAFGKATSAHEVSVKTMEAMRRWEAAGGNAAAGLTKS